MLTVTPRVTDYPGQEAIAFYFTLPGPNRPIALTALSDQDMQLLLITLAWPKQADTDRSRQAGTTHCPGLVETGNHH